MTAVHFCSVNTAVYDPLSFCCGPVWSRKKDIFKGDNDFSAKHYIVHIPSGDLYRDEPVAKIALKCFLIFVSAPLVCTLRISWYTCRMITDTAFFAIEACKRALNRNEGARTSTLYPLLKYRWQENSAKILLAPYVCIASQLGALLSIASPYSARRFIGKVEAFYNSSIKYKQAFCFLDPREKYCNPFGCLRSKARILVREAFYHAVCFQPIAHSR
jgi:hypothetical protein